MTRKERINQAFTYLKNKGIVHTQKDIAITMKASTSNVSSALSGVETVLTDNFLNRFNKAFNNVFNEEWLITGNGEMLNPQNCIKSSNIGDNSTQIAGNSNHINNSSTLDKALDEISEMRKLLAEAIKNNKEQTERLLSIIEKLGK